MKRVLKDFKSLTDEHMLLIKKQYPNGFTDHDFVEFKTANGGHFEALEIHAEDVVYLVKVSHDLLERIDDFETDYDFSDEEDILSVD